MARTRREDVLRLFVFLLLLASPFVLAGWAGPRGWLWAGLGALCWAVSVAVKILLAAILHELVRKRLAAGPQAALQGLLSALCELGAAFAAFRWILDEGTPLHAAAFGAAAGWIEMVFLFFQSRHAPGPRHVEWTFVVERGLTLAGHAASRGLVWAAVRGIAWAGPAALATFAAVDGVATFGTSRRWDWLAWPVWWRFYGFLALVSAVEMALFLVAANALD